MAEINLSTQDLDFTAQFRKKLGRENIDKLKTIRNDPVAWYSAPKGVKRFYSLLGKYAPNLFKDYDFSLGGQGLAVGSKEAIDVFKKSPEYRYGKKIESVKNKGVQAKLLGLIDSDQFQTLVEKGIAPKLTADQNIWGRLGSIAEFPLQKVLSGLTAFPRGTAGAMRASIEATKKYKEESKGVSGLFSVPLTEQIKASPEILSETFKSFFNTPGAKSTEYFAELYKDYLPERFSKSYEWTKDQDDWIRGTNWVQKLGTAVAGSPADILGLATDIVVDPLTYLTGGLAKGAKLANIGYNVVAKGGRKVIPKGATIVLKKAGQEAIEKATPRLLKVVKISNAKAIKTFKSPAMLDDFLNKKVINLFLKESKGKFTAGQLASMFDTGGLKYLGQTVVPGFKLQQVFGKSLDNLAKMKVFKPIAKFFNPQAGIDEVFRPLKAYGESLTRHIYGKNLAKFTRIVKTVPKQLEDLNKLKIIDSNIPLLERKLAKTKKWLKSAERKIEEQIFADPGNVNKATKTLDDITLKLTELKKMREGIKVTPKLQKASDDLGRLLEEVGAEEVGLGYKQAEDYFPAIFQKELDPRRWKETSIEKAFFEKSKTKDILTSLEEGLKVAPIEEAIPYRLRAGAKRLARVELTDGVKQFGVKTKGKAPKGFIELLDADGRVMKELKGWYFPKELEGSFTKVGQLFFGDEAARNAFKYYDKLLTVWKRWALATPGYHFRNFYSDTWSGVMEYGLDFLNPKHWADFVKLKKTGKLKIGSKIYTTDDFLKAGIEPGQYIAEGKLTQGIPQDLVGKISPAEWSLKFGQHREGLGRGVAGIIELKKGSTIVDAAFNVKKVFFDYMALTPAEQGIMKRIFPFYTWMRKNLQRQVELLATRTGGYASIPKFLNYLEETAQTMYGDEFFDQFKATQPEYYKDLGATITAMKTKEGLPLVWNPNLPFQDWSRLAPKDLASAMSPLIKIVTELVTNKDIFFGSTIDRAKNKFNPRYNYSKAPAWLSGIVRKFPEPVLKNMGLKTEKDEIWISDKAAYAIRQVPPLASLSRVMPASEAPKTALQMLSVGLGAKYFPFDLEKEKSARGQEFMGMVDVLKGSDAPDLDTIESVLRALYESKISEETGMSDIRSLEDMFKITGGKTEEMSLMLQLLKQPYQEAAEKISGKTLSEIVELLQDQGYDLGEEQLRQLMGAQ